MQNLLVSVQKFNESKGSAMSSDCLFCKIAEGKIPSTKVFENEFVLGFKDLHPQAAKHFLFIHKKHTKDFVDQSTSSLDQVGQIFGAISLFVKQDGLTSDGVRIVTNMGKHAGQTVFHTHFHVLGGEPLGTFGS